MFSIFLTPHPRISLIMGLAATMFLSNPPTVASDDPGEFHLRSVLPLNPGQLQQLRALAGKDPAVIKHVQRMRMECTPLLEKNPTPLPAIRYEGLLNTHAERIATVASLRSMDDVAALVEYWQATGDTQATRTLIQHLMAWSGTYKPDGNDVNENKLTPLLVAGEGLHRALSDAERKTFESWVDALGGLHFEAARTSDHLSNRYTKHLRLLALCARILKRPEWDAQVAAGFQRFVSGSLRPDGTSLDLEKRDSLTYHTSALRPLIDLAVLAGPSTGKELYHWETPEGSSLRKSVLFVVPYASGEKQRKEWMNTTVDLDRRRAEAGIQAYQPGSLYEPRKALPLLEEASAFDPSLIPLVNRLLGTDENVRFASWRMVLNHILVQ